MIRALFPLILILASCSTADRGVKFYDGSIDEVCLIEAVGMSGHITVAGEIKNLSESDIGGHIYLYKIPSERVSEYRAYTKATGGEMREFAAVPLGSQRIVFANGEWALFTIDYTERNFAHGDMYACGLSAVSNMKYRTRGAKLTYDGIENGR